mgnify:CR=1 FL=1
MPWLNLALGLALVALVIYAGLRRRRALRERLRTDPIELDDAAVRRIERMGTLATPEEEPLDLDEIEEEERRFWDDEDWNPAEQY